MRRVEWEEEEEGKKTQRKCTGRRVGGLGALGWISWPPDTSYTVLTQTRLREGCYEGCSER